MALYNEISADVLSNILAADEENRKRKQLEAYNQQKAKLDNKYNSNNGGLGGFLGSIVGGIGKGIGDVAKGTFGVIGGGAAAIKDLAEGKAGSMENQNAFKRWLYDAEDDKDAALKAAGTGLNAATTLASTVVPGLAGTGSVAGKLGTSAIANAAEGAIGGVADEFQQQGKDANLESAINRAISGGAAGLATAGLNRKIGNATGKVGSALLNNKVATSAIGRGALSGAVGGATGAGTSAALGGGDVLGSAIQGAGSGALAGGVQSGLMNAAGNIAKKARNRAWVGDLAGMEAPATATTEELQNIINEQYGLEPTNKPIAQSEVEPTNKPVTQTDAELANTNKSIANKQNQELSTSFSGKLRKKSAEALLDQYGTLTKPMAKSANAIENVQKVADAGFTKPADVERMVGAVTGDTGKVTKLTRKLVDTAKPVNTFDGINDLIDQQIAMSGLTDTDAKSVRTMVEAQLSSLPSRREGSVTYDDNASDVFKVVKNLEKRSANLKGKSGTNYSTTTPERVDKAKVVDSIATELKNRIYNNAAPMETILTSDVATDLKSLAPKNEKWANYVDNTIMKSKNIGELRNTMAPFVNMGRVIEDQYMNYGTYGQKVGDAAQIVGKGVQALFKVPVAGQIAEAVATSNAAKRLQSKAYDVASNVTRNIPEAQIPTTTSTAPTATTTIPTVPTTQANSNPNLYNFIGRTQGNIEANNAVQNARSAQDYQNLEDMFNTSMANIDAEYAPLRASMQAQQTSPAQAQLADIANGMNLALAAGDIKAYNQLADLYQTAYKMYELQNPQSKTSEMSTAEKNQIAKLESAGTALDELESLYKKAGGGQGIIGGNIANFLGGLGLNSDVNTYNQLAQGLINQIGAAIGKTDSLNTEGEVQRALSLVPKITDDNQTAMNKLSTLRQLLQTNTGTYNQLYGA